MGNLCGEGGAFASNRDRSLFGVDLFKGPKKTGAFVQVNAVMFLEGLIQQIQQDVLICLGFNWNSHDSHPAPSNADLSHANSSLSTSPASLTLTM